MGFTYDGHTLDEMRDIADDVSWHGGRSRHWDEMMDAMFSNRIGLLTVSPALRSDADAMDLTIPVRLIGVGRDGRADGHGRAGLTFQCRRALPEPCEMTRRGARTNDWRHSHLRRALNSGDFWTTLSDDFRDAVTPVVKTTGGDETFDRLWVPSLGEVAGEGDEWYEFYRLSLLGHNSTAYRNDVLLGVSQMPSGRYPNGRLLYCAAWLRDPVGDRRFQIIRADGDIDDKGCEAVERLSVVPAFCL